MSLNLYLCIHGHFYQPPRENPWLEKIDYQESASPYHDWNERIAAECYHPNGLSRILDHEGWVVRLTNNYSRISFNFGPTLLSWLEEHTPETYGAILEGDRLSRDRFGGHGSAIAQAYNHMIMPLANRRDKITQVKWGLRDFEKRFNREAEAMWLPETAVDIETLEILADHGMKYVILAPHQAQAIRPLGGDSLWQSVRGERINPRQAYQVNLPNGKSIAAFFYDGAISRAVAFEGLLNNGETFANRLRSGFDTSANPQLLHIATDGESYGHHHLHGDMALAYALDHIEKKEMATLTNYGQYLELFPPREEVQIYENSSWSCIHGVDRWMTDCGCSSGMRPSWNQKWRRPLRDAMDMVRDHLNPCYESLVTTYSTDPWAMRDDYINIILNRSDDSRGQFLQRWLGNNDIPDDTKQMIFKSLEMQRHSMLMYTSCAWFFDEISGVETVQALEYAAKALELADDICESTITTDFLRALSSAPSNIPEFGNGKNIYECFVLPARMDILKVATHLAASILFKETEEKGSFACFDYTWQSIQRLYSGKAQLIVAHVKIISQLTREDRDIEFVAIHLGDHNMNIGTLPFSDKNSFTGMAAEFTDTFSRGDMAKSLRLLDKYFESNIYYLNDLFHDQQKEIVDNVFSKTLESLEEQFNSIYAQYYPVMRYLSDIHMGLPSVFSHIAHFVQNNHIKKQLNNDVIGFEEIHRYVQEAKNWNIDLDSKHIERHYQSALLRSLNTCKENPNNQECLDYFYNLVTLREAFPFKIDIGDIQNAYAIWIGRFVPDNVTETWKETAEKIAKALKVRTDQAALA